MKRALTNTRGEIFPYENPGKSHPVDFGKEVGYTTKSIDVMDYYGRIVYQKGSVYIKNLRELLGDSSFDAVFLEMMDKFAFKNISSP